MTVKKASKSAATPGADPKPATEAEASGAIIEPSVAKLVDHPAVDNNPREGTTEEMNRIDFNDPTKPQEEAVADNLKDAG
jgi:hypothetical protein